MAKSYALSFPLLADPGAKIAQAYGVRSLLGSARRSVFIIDREGIVRYRHEDPLSLTYRSVNDIRSALQQSGLTETGAGG
jgi:peroxiredoxin Q/BCP